MRREQIITALLAGLLLTPGACAVPAATGALLPPPAPVVPAAVEAVTTPEPACPVPETAPGQWNFAAGPVKYVFEVTPASGQGYSINRLQVYPVEAEVGDIVTFHVIVTNTGTQPDTYAAALKLDGAVIQTQAVAINDGESKKLVFEVTAAFGKFEVAAGDLTAGFRVFF